MPGISFICDFNSELGNYEEIINRSFISLLHTNEYRNEVFLKNNFHHLGFTGYDEYPVQKFETDLHLFVIEGQIYNLTKNQIENHIKESVDELFTSNDNNRNKLARWLIQIDGDFIVTIVNKRNNNVLFVNDALGRLPLYEYREGNKIIISREIEFIRNLAKQKDYDTLGIAECLLFGYPLGERTFYKNVKRIPPASILIVNLDSKIISLKNVIDFDIGNKNLCDKKLGELTDELVHLFLTSCNERITKEGSNVLSLSGGLDSRAIAAALIKSKNNFNATTYRGYKEFADKDAEIAQEVAGKLNLDWKLFEVSTPKGKDHIELLKHKGGMNTLASTFLLSFYKGMKTHYGNGMSYITGDGGDKVFPDHRPALKLKNLPSLVDYTISNKYYFSPRKVSALLNIEEDMIKQELVRHFAAYPEEAIPDKFAKFIIAERGIKWLFEAEDRNRFYFWSLTPFYSIPFFFYSMNIPDNYKSRHKLYNEFLVKLSPEIQNIKNALWNVPINPDNIGFKTFLFIKDRVYPLMPGRLKRTLRMKINLTEQINIPKNENLNTLFFSLSNSSIVKEIFNTKELLQLTSMNKAEFYNLLTILLAIERFEYGNTSLHSYIEEELV